MSTLGLADQAAGSSSPITQTQSQTSLSMHMKQWVLAVHLLVTLCGG